MELPGDVSYVGVDIAERLIDRARRESPEKGAEWIVGRAEDLVFPQRGLRAVFSYEAFHLFSARSALVRRIGAALDEAGVFIIGWRTAKWEDLLRGPTLDVYAMVGIPLADWASWRCDDMAALIHESGADRLQVGGRL
jgi:SAM-dependent methyltransferase